MQNGDVYSSVVIILQCVPQSRHQLPGQHPVSLLPFVSNDYCILARLCWFAGTHEDTFPREAMWKCLRGIVLLLNLTYYVRLCENRPLRRVLTEGHQIVDVWNKLFIRNTKHNPQNCLCFLTTSITMEQVEPNISTYPCLDQIWLL